MRATFESKKQTWADKRAFPSAANGQIKTRVVKEKFLSQGNFSSEQLTAGINGSE